MGDGAITRALEAVFADLSREQGNDIFYAYSLETGKHGWRHPHILVGNISRLSANQVASVFQAHRFGAVDVKRWDRTKEHGYAFKSLDPQNPSYDENAAWFFNVTWNRRCTQKMKLCRKHLEKLDGPSEWSSADQSRPSIKLDDVNMGRHRAKRPLAPPPNVVRPTRRRPFVREQDPSDPMSTLPTNQ